jgi:uncharacterized protein YjbI with pentapeptide repeats
MKLINLNRFFQQQQQFVLLFDSITAAQNIAYMLNGQWDECNGVIIAKCDEVAVNTAAALMEASWCYQGASFAVLTRLTTDQILHRYAIGERNFSNANLRCAKLCMLSLSEINLSWAKLSLANLSGTNLRRANLTMTDMREANLSETNLSHTCLVRANLRSANLSRADLKGANLSHCCLNDANLSEADLRGANLTQADLRGSNLTGALFN